MEKRIKAARALVDERPEVVSLRASDVTAFHAHGEQADFPIAKVRLVISKRFLRVEGLMSHSPMLWASENLSYKDVGIK